MNHTGVRFACAFAAVIVLAACGKGGMQMKKPEQGLHGTFTSYGPKADQVDCSPFVTQADKDTCRKQNARGREEPVQGSILVRNLHSGDSIKVALNPDGSYRVLLKPGEYEVCVPDAEECSDPLEVSMGRFVPYGQRLPRPLPPAPEDTPRASHPAPKAEVPPN